MVQLTAIFTTQILYGTIGIVFVTLFGVAIGLEWNAQLAPRSSNRPKSVIKNALLLQSSSTTGRCYPLSFIWWAMQLTYPQGLRGIPGTGSRNNGWAGPTLKWDLDGVILLKYHRMLMKISIVATMLCLLVLLPAFSTAECDPKLLGSTCQEVWNLTDFETLTIAHIPDKMWSPINQTITTTLPNGTITVLPTSTVNPIQGQLWVPGISSRFLLVVLCCVVLYSYTCYLLWHEWLDNLALRRIYFLESDHYPRRIQELDNITAIQNIIPPDEQQKDRPPYIPDPELRDTPPAVGLYSVLYQLPKSLITYDSDGATQLERQIVATTNFFDECVPAQPGFSSSVAAVTIIPDAARVAKVWMKWYKIETKLRRLRYIKKIVQHKLDLEAEGRSDIYNNIANAVEKTKHGLNSATNSVSQQLSAVLSSNALTINLCGSADQSDQQQQQQPPSEEEDVAGDKQSNNICPNEVEPLVSNQQSFSTIEFVAADNDLKSKEEKGEDSVSNRFVDEREATAAPVHEESVLVSLWTKWRGGDVQADKTQKDIEMQSVRGSTHSEGSVQADSNDNVPNPSSSSSNSHQEEKASHNSQDDTEDTRGFCYEDFDVKAYARKLGFDEETELNGIVDGLGIEELSIFAREYAQSSANPCVYGMYPKLLNFKTLDELKDMESELWDELREANEELRVARKYVVELDDDEESLIATGLEAKNSDEEGVIEESGEFAIPSATTQVFSSSKRGGLRNRCTATSSADQWEMAQAAATEMRFMSDSRFGCTKPSCWSRIVPCFGEQLERLPSVMGNSGKAFVTALYHPTYAVVTFTSRQAAIAARQSLADGGAINAWKQVDDIPIAPLADAPPRNILFCRGCCRPVTLTINYKEKKFRRWTVIAFLFFFCCLYTIPLATIQNLANPNFLAKLFPDAEGLHDPTSPTYKFFAMVAGPFSSLMLTLFFSFLPQLFKFLAFYDGTSSSIEKAEQFALLLYWYFMLVTAFAGASLANMFFSWLSSDFSAEDSIRSVLNEIAGAIPGHIAPTWLNWIIMRYSFTWTGGYLFQMNAFITHVLNMKWLNRVMRGGGPGPPTPYRIYIDSGVVFMCITSLSPACPLIAPAAMIYFFVVQPILRWLLIFVYRPKYDGGGGKWPQLHHIVISALILGQILMGVTLSLKAAYWEGIFVGCCAIPTYFFHLWTWEQFYRPYHDCALLQTSRLDAWQESHSLKKREEYRRWLVDCHKASYVPLCLLGTKENLLTAEPAVVVPKESDEDSANSVVDMRQRMKRQSAQKGAIFNRKYM